MSTSCVRLCLGSRLRGRAQPFQGLPDEGPAGLQLGGHGRPVEGQMTGGLQPLAVGRFHLGRNEQVAAGQVSQFQNVGIVVCCGHELVDEHLEIGGVMPGAAALGIDAYQHVASTVRLPVQFWPESCQRVDVAPCR